ncbi:hypothetical protein AVEN_162306-1 [Araneus ventricosus]|uniref:Mos1 transposase HTH domain-containing protein n=1 Tax=Araneus ventricosus TaxID=182803 RepID=A0A4Y2LVV9_ARAVE|nr:hypothetical protein AVEN_162306-1 [Araneus ventricosus]
MEQRVNVKFCFKLGKTATETHEMSMKVYGVEAVSKKCVFEWFKRFRDGKEDDKRSDIRVRQFLSTRKVTVLEHPPYSLDLAPADFLFLRLKGVQKGLRFSDISSNV